MQLIDSIIRFFKKNYGVKKIDGVFDKFKNMISDLDNGKQACCDQRSKNSAEMKRLSAESDNLSKNIIRAETLKAELEKILGGTR